MQQDVLADALSAIDNARRIDNTTVEIEPASDLIKSVLRLLQQEGYIGMFEHEEDTRGGQFKVEIKDTINKCSPIKPRFAVGNDEFQKYEKRYLPARGFGQLIVTTPDGIKTHTDARDQGIGGRLLGYVY